MSQRTPLAVISVLLSCSVPAATAGQVAQQPRAIELDSATIAANTEAARTLIPLLNEVKDKAVARYQTEKGSVPDSPFAGTQTTAIAITVGKKSTPVDPQVVKAIEQLLDWEPGDRSATEESALFDAWLAELSKRASSIATRRGQVSCDTGCVVQTVTTLDDSWGASEKQRPDARDQMLLDTFSAAVKKKR